MKYLFGIQKKGFLKLEQWDIAVYLSIKLVK